MAAGRGRGGPDRRAALAQYRDRAGVYDAELRLFEPVRRRAVALLGLRRGDTVIDVGCGTGLSFALLEDAVGDAGRLVGIEQSPEMIARARERVAAHGWSNVTLVNSPVEDARLPRLADAALFHFTHDILRNPRAVARVCARLRPDAPVVACGLKWAPPWALATNLGVLVAALRSVTAFEGLAQPWSHLATHLDHVEVGSSLAGGVFVLRGSVRR